MYTAGGLELGTVRSGRAAPPPLHVNDKLGVSVGESSKLVLVQVHDEEFVRGRELHRLPGELFVEVGRVSFVFLLKGKHRVNGGKGGSAQSGGSSQGVAARRALLSPGSFAVPGHWRSPQWVPELLLLRTTPSARQHGLCRTETTPHHRQEQKNDS